MSTANVTLANASGLPPALRTAQEAIRLPEVQAMLQRLAEYQLGIFMPHRHDEQTGEFQPLPDDVMQVESGLAVSFKPTPEILNQGARFFPVGWLWRAGAAVPVAACEMVWDEGQDGSVRQGKHTMSNED
ncbi:MAG: hypothetical protein ABI665_17610 [Vicinamibacterales bacterium]